MQDERTNDDDDKQLKIELLSQYGSWRLSLAIGIFWYRYDLIVFHKHQGKISLVCSQYLLVVPKCHYRVTRQQQGDILNASQGEIVFLETWKQNPDKNKFVDIFEISIASVGCSEVLLMSLLPTQDLRNTWRLLNFYRTQVLGGVLQYVNRRAVPAWDQSLDAKLAFSFKCTAQRVIFHIECNFTHSA